VRAGDDRRTLSLVGALDSAGHVKGVVPMRRYLVVANRTLGGEHLADEIRRRLAEARAAGEECAFHVLVPLTHLEGHAVETEGAIRAGAELRLAAAVDRFRAWGVDATGEVGDSRPLTAISDVLRHREVDEIILSTLPPGPSQWLKLDLPHRVERTFAMPVTHVVAEREAAAAT
jgi:hypothetical protein